jgi:hypothetical protein
MQVNKAYPKEGLLMPDQAVFSDKSKLLNKLLDDIKASDVASIYTKETGEFPRTDLGTEVNPTGEALKRFHDLQRRLKIAQTDIQAKASSRFAPDEAVRDSCTIIQFIDDAIMVLLAQGDGTIDNANFKKLFPVLATMTEAFLVAVKEGWLARAKEVRDVRLECVGKAFYKQLQDILASKNKVTEAALKKAVFSLGTHLSIAEEKGKPHPYLMSEVLKMLSRLGKSRLSEEIERVKSWGLIK